MAAPALALTPAATPEVGEFCHTCRGAHTSEFTVPLSGLPPLTPVVLNWSVSGRDGGTYADQGTTDASGSITFRRQYRDVGQPVPCRTVNVTTVQVTPPFGEIISLNETYEGCCPGGSSLCP
jgi:hypothetical protein